MLRKSALILFALLPLAACGDDDGAGPPADDLVGTWTATVIEQVSVADPGTKIDLVDFGYTGTITLEQDGDFFLTFFDPELGNFGATGHWSSTDVLTMDFTAGEFLGTWQFDINLSGNTLRLTGADTEFDFDDDGTEEAAKLNLTLVRDQS